LPIQTRSNLFGVHLEELMGYDGEKGGVPRVVKDCVQYLRQTGAPVAFTRVLILPYFARLDRRRVISALPELHYFASSEGCLRPRAGSIVR